MLKLAYQIGYELALQEALEKDAGLMDVFTRVGQGVGQGVKKMFTGSAPSPGYQKYLAQRAQQTAGKAVPQAGQAGQSWWSGLGQTLKGLNPFSAAQTPQTKIVVKRTVAPRPATMSRPSYVRGGPGR